jgi:hypothetical protein
VFGMECVFNGRVLGAVRENARRREREGRGGAEVIL